MAGPTRLLVLVAVTVLLGGRARAADRADDLMKKAVELRRVGDDQGAYPLLREAYELSHSPRAVAQWGFCEQALGRWAEAEVHLSESLKGAADPWVQKNRLAIEQSLTIVKSHIARLEIVGEPAGAEVLVNGNPVGQLPLPGPVRATAGEIEIELRAAGFPRTTKSLRVDGGQYQKVILRAERHVDVAAPPVTVAAAASPLGEPGSAAPTATAAPPGAAPPSTPVAADAGGGTSAAWRPVAKWASWGLGAVALGLGVYGVAHNRTLVSDFDRGCGIDPQTGPYALSGSGRTDGACATQKSDYESASRLGTIGLVAGAILAVAGVVFFVTEPRPGPATAGGTTETALRSWSCSPAWMAGAGTESSSRTELSMTCSARF